MASQAALGHLIELERMVFLQLLTADMFSYGVLVLLLSAGKVMVVKISRSLPCVQDDITVHRMHHAAHVTREDGWNLPLRVLSTQVRASPPWTSHQSPWCSGNQLWERVLHSLHIAALREIFVSASFPRFVARLATVQALRSLTIQVLELHCFDEIGVPYQVYLSTQFTSLYFHLMSCIRFD